VTRIDTATDPPGFDTFDFTDDDAVRDPDPYGAAVAPNGLTIWVTLNGFDQVARLTNGSFAGSGMVAVDLPEGSRPQGVAIDTQGAYAYVANFGNNNVSKIDLGTYAVVGEAIAVGAGPRGIAAFYDEEADENRVYVANSDDNTLTVITDDFSTITKETITGVGGGPIGLALTPDGARLYVAAYNDDVVTVIRTSDNAVIDTIGVGDGPWGMAVGRDGYYAYVTNSLDNTVWVIATDTGAIAATFGTGAKPQGVAAPKYGDFAYVVNQDGNSISRIDMGDNTVEEIGAGEIEEATALGAFIGGARPSAPSNLTASETSSDTIELTWTDNSSDELGFKIERRTEDEDAFIVIADVDADTTAFTDEALDNSTTYVYRIRAYNEATESTYSTQTSAQTDGDEFSWCFIGTLLQ
ncbi:MAG: fibronectin type III domain-containing protein, partial [Desulfosarcinaceae bacterium]